MRALVIILTVFTALLVVHELMMGHHIHSLQSEVNKLRAELQSQHGHAELDRTTSQDSNKAAPDTDSASLARAAADRDRLAVLEGQVQSLTRSIASLRPWSGVPEYNTQFPPGPDAPANTNNLKRDWGPEQMVGPPDTERAGDAVTAWASLEANAGPEWVSVSFANAVPLAEVRIRENFNAGAITKVTTMSGGQEITLWEGTAPSARGLRDFVVPVDRDVLARSIIIHLDTTRVQGWNEIDAVELVGRDGSRQWATEARASTTWAERPSSTQPQIQIRTQ